MTWAEVRKWFFNILVAAMGWLVVGKVDDISNSLKDLSSSVQSLNVMMAKVVLQQGHQDGSIKDHESRIRVLERR